MSLAVVRASTRNDSESPLSRVTYSSTCDCSGVLCELRKGQGTREAREFASRWRLGNRRPERRRTAVCSLCRPEGRLRRPGYSPAFRREHGPSSRRASMTGSRDGRICQRGKRRSDGVHGAASADTAVDLMKSEATAEEETTTDRPVAVSVR